MLTKTQINKIEKAAGRGTGDDINISKTQIRKFIKQGGSIFGCLISIGTKMLPMAAKVAPHLATGALSVLGSLGSDKIFGKGMKGGFLIPNEKIDQLIKYKHLLTKNQKERILNTLQSGGQLVFKPTEKQRGGLLGSLLASIGIPLALELFGKGLTVPKKAGN